MRHVPQLPDNRTMSDNDEDEPELRINVAPEETFLENRDPMKVTVNMVKTDFNEVIAEPEGVHSVDAVWIISYVTYTKSRAFLYYGLTSIFGIPVSLIWGLTFALLSFLNIWVIVPFIKLSLFIFRCAMHPVLTCIEYWLRSPFRIVIETVHVVKQLFRKTV